MAPTPPSLSLAGKIAIISGSGKENGIGAGIALALAEAGARVTLNHVSDATAPRAAKVVEKIESIAGKGTAIVVQADVSEPEGCKKIVEETLKTFGGERIDIVVNNAVAGKPIPALAHTKEDLLEAFSVSVFGPIYLIQAAYPHMDKGGRIINISSIAPRQGSIPVYAATKAALDSLTFTLARELGVDGKGVTVNSILSGPVMTEPMQMMPKEMVGYLVSLTRAEARVGTVEDIADAVLLLVSEKSRWITGQLISASGGIIGG